MGDPEQGFVIEGLDEKGEAIDMFKGTVSEGRIFLPLTMIERLMPQQDGGELEKLLRAYARRFWGGNAPDWTRILYLVGLENRQAEEIDWGAEVQDLCVEPEGIGVHFTSSAGSFRAFQMPDAPRETWGRVITLMAHEPKVAFDALDERELTELLTECGLTLRWSDS